MKKDRQTYLLYIFFGCGLFLNTLFWSQARTVRESWSNVPAVPGPAYASLVGLGDDGLSYRMTGYLLQNFGNTGGDYMPVDAYDFGLLEKWFFLAHQLDPLADYVPFMAAYFFGTTDVPENNAHLVNYLREAGKTDYPDKWRWLAQAVYKARYKMNDNEYALTLANELASLPVQMAPWARQMPAFINLQLGNKEAAYGIMLQMLQSEGGHLDPAEVKFMIDFICNRTLGPSETKDNPLCQMNFNPL